jgi:hypothetical protein
MGIIDDYYGGYGNLAMLTNSDGEVDFEAAYDSQLPDEDGYYDPDLDPLSRGIDYKMRSMGLSMPPRGRRGQRDQRQQQRPRKQTWPGWTKTDRTTFTGREIWEGTCTTCQVPCTVPFRPLVGGSAPKCKGCLGGPSGSSQNTPAAAPAAADGGPSQDTPTAAAAAAGAEEAEGAAVAKPASSCSLS